MSRIDRATIYAGGNPAGAIAKPRGTETRRYGRPEKCSKPKKKARIIYRSGLPLNQALEQLDLLLDNEDLQHLRRFCNCLLEGRRGSIPGGSRQESGSRTSLKYGAYIYQYW